MTNPHPLSPRLITGMRMDRDEFLRTWEQIPDVKNAELIEGIVYVPSPVGASHGELDTSIIGWLHFYASFTPGCKAGNNTTWLMLESSPQPDAHLRILSTSRIVKDRFEGAPDLAAEVCVTSSEVDFGPKLALYQRAGVREYITLETLIKRVQWRVLDQGSYRRIEPGADGIVRSETFPGLWLDLDALWSQNSKALLEWVRRGVSTPEHATFVTTLANSE
jgi:Uma2 family endonuclease